MSKQALEKAVEIAGGQVALAAAIRDRMPGCKVSQAHISKWLLRLKGETPPSGYVVAISAAVDWKVTPHELRDDIYPNPSDAMPADKVEAAA